MEPIRVKPLWVQLKREGVRPDDLLRRLGIVAPPIDVASIIQRLGITLRFVKSPGWYAAVAADDESGVATIWVDAEDPVVRQRFSMAHEIGHLLLHPSGVAYRDDSFRGDSKETQANAFAADLLMPTWMLGPLAIAYRGNIPLLAGAFDVSQEAMRYRLKKVRA